MNVIRHPFLCQSSMTLKKPLPSAAAGPSSLLMSPLQASALSSAFSYYHSDSDDSDGGLEDLSFEPLTKPRVRLDYVSDYEWDEDNDYLEDYVDSDDDDACSVDSDMTLTISNKYYDHYQYGGKQLSPVSSSTTSTAAMSSDDCSSICSGVSFDSEVAVAKYHQPTPTYHHHHRNSSPVTVLSPPSPPPPTTKKETRHSFSSVSSSTKSKKTSSVKKPFVRADLMPTPLSKQHLLVAPHSPPPRCCKGPIISRRLFRTCSSRSAASVKTI